MSVDELTYNYECFDWTSLLEELINSLFTFLHVFHEPSEIKKFLIGKSRHQYGLTSLQLVCYVTKEKGSALEGKWVTAGNKAHVLPLLSFFIVLSSEIHLFPALGSMEEYCIHICFSKYDRSTTVTRIFRLTRHYYLWFFYISYPTLFFFRGWISLWPCVFFLWTRKTLFGNWYICILCLVSKTNAVLVDVSTNLSLLGKNYANYWK